MRKTVDLGDRKVTLIGTAHVSEKSRQEVIDTIDELNPDHIAVELDKDRFESLKNKSGWKNLDIAEAIKEGKGSLLFFNLMLSIYQRRIGLKEGVKPGEEMLGAVEKAEENGIGYSLIDRNISETFERIRQELGFWEKINLLASLFGDEVEVDIEELKDEDIIGNIVKDLEKDFPSIKQVFLDERNTYMVDRLLEQEFDHAVVVIGAAHLEGMVEELKGNRKTFEEDNSLFKMPWMKILKYGMPLAIIAGLGYSFYKIGYSTGVNATSFWILSNGLLAMAGAILARSHFTTWIVSFVAAPLTSLDPALGAGMVASYFEGKFYPPKVEELESIAYIENYRDLWDNQVGRILLTLIFVTIGSATATFVSAGYIASLIA